MVNADFLNEMFGQMTGDKKYDKFGYHCTKCQYELDQVVVETPLRQSKKLFWCRNKSCLQFGIVTVVAIKKQKG